MTDRDLSEILDEAIGTMLSGRRVAIALGDARAGLDVAGLIGVARDLKELPSSDFRRRLAVELSAAAAAAGERGKRKRKGGSMATSQVEAAAKAAESIVPHLVVRDAAAAIEFYRSAFGATELMRLTEPGGRIGHAEVRLGGARWMLADEYPEYGIRAPSAPGAAGVRMSLSVPDVDAFAARAAAAGALLESPPRDEFYGDRTARLVDPFGHVWQVSTRKELVSPSEMQRRFDELLAGQPAPAQAQVEAPQDSARPPVETPAARPGFHAVTPYLQVRRPAELIDFVKAAFGAVETLRTTGSAGGTHGEVRIGDSMVMIGGMESLAREAPATIYLYVSDVDRTYERALAAGGTSMLPPTDQPYGDRNAWIHDPFGNTWYIASHSGGGEPTSAEGGRG